MKPLEEIWEELANYLRVDKALEQGFSSGKYTKILAKYAKKVIGIDKSSSFMKIAKENLKTYSNIELLLMDARKMSFPDKSFNVLLNTSFHEFDLSSEIYSVDLKLKEEILKEMIRVANTIIFVEPTENAVTNELFKVFNPSENHSDRIHQSNQLISKVMNSNGYALAMSGKTYNDDHFPSLEELEKEMLEWWSDIKTPENNQEKQLMINQIDNILQREGMLEDLHVIEEIEYRVYTKKEIEKCQC